MVSSEPQPYPFLAILAGHLAVAAIATIAAVAWSVPRFELPNGALAASLVALIVPFAACEPVRRRTQPTIMGMANRITLVRGCMVAWVTAFVATAGTPDQAMAVAIVASVALAMDGLDGLAARKTQTESEFGGQFDMEFDSVLMLVLSWLAFAWDQAGAWVLFCGLARYVWLAVSANVAWFNRPLLPAFRRKTACVIGVMGLIGAVAPLPFSWAWAAAATGTLALSFGIDVVWLVRHRKEPLS